MSLGYALEQKTIDENIVLEALKDLDLDALNTPAPDEPEQDVDKGSRNKGHAGRGKPNLLGSWWRKVAAVCFVLIAALSWPAPLNTLGRNSLLENAGIQAARWIRGSIAKVSATHVQRAANPASYTLPLKVGTP